MSNEVNISEITSGTLDPGVWIEWNMQRYSYDQQIHKVAAFTIVPDPWLPAVGGRVEWSGPHDMEIIRTWNTVWSSSGPDGPTFVFQRNVRIKNTGNQAASFHLLLAETDN